MGKFETTKQYEGERPFRCPRCHRLAVTDIQGEFRLVIVCNRCHAKLTLEVNEPLPEAVAVKSGAFISQ